MEFNMKRVKVGVIGCGNISAVYLKNCTTVFSNILEVVACADIDIERAKARAEEFNIPNAYTVEQILADPGIEIIINLTIPNAHYGVCMSILETGKNVYVEKPLAATREKGGKIIEKAKEKGLLVGGAPDTFLGAGIQTCRRLIDEGAIGDPVAATAFMTCRGHERWHPDPEFYYKAGGGPLFDMGPYYLTALVSLIGPVAQVKSSARITFPQRTITSKPKYGQKIDVDVPTHVSAILDFENGAVGTLITSFDVWATKLPFVQIYGTEGSLDVPDPNTFGGPVRIFHSGASAWEVVPVDQNYTENSRGLGVADMAYALQSGNKHRANSNLTFHVLDVMQGILESSEQKIFYDIKSTCERPRSFDGKNFI
jgi:predicted dehydrogenase